jgi:cholesterol oxidase
MTYSLQFTERMTGAFSFGKADYQAGYAAGRRAGNRLSFRLTIAAADVAAFLADPRHQATASGYVDCDPLGGRFPVQQGAFDLFTDAGPATRHMLYRLYFADATGRPLTLAGYKDVRPGPLTAVWPETSTLYARILNGHVPVDDGGEHAAEGMVGSGILRIPPPDFAWQLTTFRVHGPTLAGRIDARDSFGQLFLSELWQVFGPVRRLTRKATGNGAGGSDAIGSGAGGNGAPR